MAEESNDVNGCELLLAKEARYVKVVVNRSSLSSGKQFAWRSQVTGIWMAEPCINHHQRKDSYILSSCVILKLLWTLLILIKII